MKISFIEYKIYLFYDQPCLLSYVTAIDNCVNSTFSDYYLAVWVEEPSLYLFSKVDLKDLVKLENDKDLLCRHLFVNSNHSFLYDIELQRIVEELQVIPEDYLPL